ncbi:hypothetical protein ACVWWK_006113 [Bradyrhizobium sp. LB9.1b]
MDSTIAALVVGGSISMTLYVIHARRTGSPVLDFSLLRLPTLRAAILGGFIFRLGIGALPFLLPLLMQIGFGLSPFKSGLVTFGSSLGAMGMKALAARIIRAFGFRKLMTVNALVSAVFLAACALFTVTTPLLIIMIILVIGGFFRSLEFTAINTVAYAEVETAQMSRATHARQRQPAARGLGRRRRGCRLGGDHDVAQPCQRAQRHRVCAGLRRDRPDLGCVELVLLADAR